MLTIYLCKHGKTESNTNSVTMWQIDSPLTQEGLNNTKHIGELLKNEKIDLIFSSDLGRAFMTAYYIQKINKDEIEIIPTKELREINYGDFAHQNKQQVKQNCKHYKTDVNYIFPNGESYQQVQDRVIDFIEKTEKENENKTILIVTHSGAIRAINTYYKQENFQEKLKEKFGHEYIGKFKIDKNKLIEYKQIN